MKFNLLITLVLTGMFFENQVMAESEALPKSEVIPERKMGVRQGPDSVFDTGVDKIMPDLKGATATNENGRIGNELVFWGYRLASGEPVYFYACAPVEGVDCMKRSEAICPVQTQVITRSEQSGKLSRFRCEAICATTPGRVLPCCNETSEQNTMMIGLVKCR